MNIEELNVLKKAGFKVFGFSIGLTLDFSSRFWGGLWPDL